MSETTVTNPAGSDRKRRTMDEISDSFNQMLVGEPEEQPEPVEAEDSLEEQEVESELSDDLDEVDEFADEEADEEQSEGEGATYRVLVDGKEMQIPLDELLSGYQRGSSFTQKSQALADERNAFADQQTALGQERQTYASVLQQLRQQMEAAAQPNIDWDTLERQDPVQWLKLKQMERDREGRFRPCKRNKGVCSNSSGTAVPGTGKTPFPGTDDGAGKIPEWSDSDLQADEQRKLLEYGKTLGFSDEELGQIYDHRALIALRDAWRYNQLTNGEKIQTAKSKIGSARSGNKETSRRVRSRKQKAMRQKLKATGKVDDAAALFGELLAD